MKTNIRSISLTIILLAICFAGFAQIQIIDVSNGEEPTKYVQFRQEHSKLEQSTHLLLDKESENSEIKISVDKAIDLLSLKIEVKLTAGEIEVNVINTKNLVKESFTVINNSDDLIKGKKTQSRETVSGQLEKHFRDVGTGVWLVRIIPKNASGSVKIFRSLISNPRADLMEIDDLK